MRTRIYYLSSIVFLFGECAKNAPTPAPVPTPVKCYLLTATSTSPSYDAQIEKAYALNADKKITSITTTVKSTSGTSATAEIFSYGSNGRISQVAGANYFFSYSYNGSGRLITISYTIDNVLSSVTNITYNSFGQITKKAYMDLKSGVLTNNGYRVYDYADNASMNATKESLYDPLNVLQFTVEYEYDDKPLPLASVEFEQTPADAPAVNNKTKSTYTQITATPFVSVTTSAYQYNDKGYPTQIATTTPYSTETVNYLYDCK